jgi:hypothetical protein
MLGQAAAAVKRARAEGVNRFVLRLFLPRGDGLSPPDESWQGGIMQLFSVCSPLTRELLRLLSTEIAGVPPALREQRIDASGVDGESVWFAQSSQPQDDCVAVVQPMAESLKTIRQISSDAGRRPMLLVNPQWKERDDPLDALSRKGGLLGMMGNFMGGKAAMEAELETINSGKVKKKKDSGAQKWEDLIERCKYHEERLELILRLIDNEGLSPEQVDACKDQLEFLFEKMTERLRSGR